MNSVQAVLNDETIHTRRKEGDNKFGFTRAVSDLFNALNPLANSSPTPSPSSSSSDPLPGKSQLHAELKRLQAALTPLHAWKKSWYLTGSKAELAVRVSEALKVEKKQAALRNARRSGRKRTPTAKVRE